MLKQMTLKSGAVLICSWMLFSGCEYVSTGEIAQQTAAAQAAKQKQNQKQNQELSAKPEPATPSVTNSPKVPVLTFDQKLDPSDPSDTRTFKQRYAVDSRFAQGKDSPVIYYICGEMNCFSSGSDLTAADGASYPALVKLEAQNLHAYVVELEHRYFGLSQPFDQLTGDNLKYLSIDNALTDLAVFQKSISQSMGLAGKWVAIGGSYPGALAAFYRLKHPELVVGAYASSAPVQATGDFETYDEATAQGLGSDCLGKVQDATHQIEQSLNDPATMTYLKNMFGVPKVKDNLDFLNFVATIGQFSVQFGYVQQTCKLLSGNGDPVENLAAAGKQLYAALKWDPMQLGTIQGLEPTDVKDYETGLGMRQWDYIACSALGFFTVPYHDPKLSAESSLLTLSFQEQACSHLFGTTKLGDYDATNQEFYDQLLEPSTTNILYTNGSEDPYATVSISRERGNDTNPHTSVYTIQGASHCEDLTYGPKMKNPSDSMKAAAALIDQSLKLWLGIK